MTPKIYKRFDEPLSNPAAVHFKVMLGAEAYPVLARAILSSGKVRLTIEGDGESVSASCAVQYVDGGGNSRQRVAVLAQIDEFEPHKVTP